MDTTPDVVAFLRGIAGELADIHRCSDYSLWLGKAKHRVDHYLSRGAILRSMDRSSGA